MNFSKLENFLREIREPSYRLDQIKKAYCQNLATDFKHVTSLPEPLRQALEENLLFDETEVVKLEASPDGKTIKNLLRLNDGEVVESVLMKHPHWITVCLSTQVGCSLDCAFCATGALGFKRNLTPSEIYEQIVHWNRHLSKESKKVTHLVFMGMGEPFLNWNNLWESLKIIMDPEALGIGERKISISTAGITPRIKDFTAKNTQINIAVSLNAPTQAAREKIMPVAKTYPLPELLEACREYVDQTKRKIFFEYVLVDKVNDSLEMAQKLTQILKKHYLYHLNLINLNKTCRQLEPATKERFAAFVETLKINKVPFTIRQSYGSPLAAACGQLAGNKR
ncbi:MAG: 23S rRNA (adenine(2503)-C(2))-methyltransferase RlmN [bacterium]|nr:23S rRNA (adenine(2503)-C(2))-methyltransferase RlmN [bacterium]